MEEVECKVCGCGVSEDEAVFDLMDVATCLDCELDLAKKEKSNDF